MDLKRIDATEVTLSNRMFIIERGFDKVSFCRHVCRGICLEDHPSVSGKIVLVRFIRNELDLSLKDAKEFVEQA